MSASLVVVGPNLKDPEYTLHIHDANCEDKKNKQYREFQDDWNSPLEVDSIQSVVELAFGEVISESEGDWTEYEDQIKFFSCVDIDALEYENSDSETATPVQNKVSVTLVIPVKEVVKKVTSVSASRYAISGVISLEQLLSLGGGSFEDTIGNLEALGIKVRESKNKSVYVKKAPTEKCKSLKNYSSEFVVAGSSDDLVKIVLPGSAATALGLTAGEFSSRGRGTQYVETVTRDSAGVVAENLRGLIKTFTEKTSRTLDDWKQVNALDKALGRVIEVLGR